MAITRPNSGSKVQKSDIQGMHASVAALVNAVAPTQLDRSALNHHQLPSVFVDGDSLNVVGSTRISQAMTDEGTADILANWTEITSFTLNNSGAGYVFPAGAAIVAYVTLRWENFYDNGGAGTIIKPEERQQQWAALTYEVDGVELVDLVDSGLIHGQREASNDIYVEAEECVTIWTYFAYGVPFTLNALRLRVALGEGGPAGGAPQFVDVDGGHIGFIAFPAQ